MTLEAASEQCPKATFPDSVLLVVLEFFQVLIGILHNNPRVADLWSFQKQLVNLCKFGRLGHAMFDCIGVFFDTVAKVNFVEANICAFILASSSLAERKESALSHGGHNMRGNVSLRPGTDCPCALWVSLLQQVADGVPVRDYREWISPRR